MCAHTPKTSVHMSRLILFREHFILHQNYELQIYILSSIFPYFKWKKNVKFSFLAILKLFIIEWQHAILVIFTTVTAHFLFIHCFVKLVCCKNMVEDL